MQLVQILSIIISLSVFLIVIEIVRRRLLKERYALIWLFTSFAILTLSVWRELLHIMAQAFGFYYPPSFLFLAGLGFLHLIVLHFSIVLSKLTEKNKRLAQELGIMRDELQKVQKSIKRGEDSATAHDRSREHHMGPET
jgi:hypothetical protein